MEKPMPCFCSGPGGPREGRSPQSSFLLPPSLFGEHPLLAEELVLAWEREAWGLLKPSGFRDLAAQETCLQV